jgi:hypothetical protein
MQQTLSVKRRTLIVTAQAGCSVSASYPIQQIVGEDFWLSTAIIGSFLLFFPLLMWHRRHLCVSYESLWHFYYDQQSPRTILPCVLSLHVTFKYMLMLL